MDAELIKMFINVWSTMTIVLMPFHLFDFVYTYVDIELLTTVFIAMQTCQYNQVIVIC